MRAALATIAALLALAACTGTTDERPGPAEPVISQPVGLDRVTVEDEPAWTVALENADRYQLTFHDDVAVLLRDPASIGMDVTVLDADTGDRLWSRKLGEVPGFEGHHVETIGAGAAVAGAAGEEVVLVGYYVPDCLTEPCPPAGRQSSERGVLGLDLRTGEIRWTYPAVPSVDKDGEPDRHEALRYRTLRIAGGPQGGPLVAVGPFEGSGERIDDPEAYHSVELDPGTGDEVWSATGVIARLMLDDRVIGVSPLPLPAESSGRPSNLGAPVAVDRRTGQELWRHVSDRQARLAGTGQGQLILTHLDDERIVEVIDGSDGSLTRRIDGAWGDPPPGAVDPESGLLVYRDPDEPGRLFSLLPDEEEVPARSGAAVDCSGAKRVWQGYIQCLDQAELTTTVYDRSGTAVSEVLPGLVVALSDDYYVSTQQDGVIAAYARR
ncbi:hypothetical protein [Aeromicrobium sp. CTD01-1L150]|uniref:hypothetical protein n=1 Tax=Aeromicrobium sp. CTD01-1L150 TaxID=3341830 RepID=UPI0035C26B28